MSKKSKNTKSATIDPNLSLAQVSERYLEHMESDGKSVGTCFSYAMELKTAQGELGADTLVASITPEQIEAFNNCARVMKLKSGKPKAEPSFMKTRRVIRLALNWAEQAGVIAKSPIAAKVQKIDAPAPAPEPTPTPKKPRKAKRVEPETSDATAPEEVAAPAA